MRRWGAKRDGNERAIVDALKGEGFSVVQISHPDLPDLLVWRRGRPPFVLLEVKADAGKLKPGQLKFFTESEGTMRFLIRSADEALAVCRTWIDGYEGEGRA